MSMAMAVRLVLGLICGLVLTWLVWDRSERELAERWDEEHLRPRFLPFSGSYYLPTLMLLYPILGAISGGAQKAVQLTLGLLLRVFLEAGIYYVLLLAMMPRLRRWVSARVCAMLWLLPDWLYVFAGRPDRPTDGKMLVLHAPGVLVYVLLAIWVVGAVGVMVWKIGSHLAFRRRILKNAVPGHGPGDAARLGSRAGARVDPKMQMEDRALRGGHDAAVHRAVQSDDPHRAAHARVYAGGAVARSAA